MAAVRYRRRTSLPTPFSVETMGRDLDRAHDRPLWPLSSYGPAKAALTLITNLDESPEELRVKAVTAMKANTIQEYVSVSLVS